MPSPLHVLVTGAFGNLGRHALPELLARGHRVRAIAHGAGDLEVANAFRNRVEVVEADVRDREAMARAVRGVDVVAHLAFVIPPPAFENLDLAESVNVGGTRTLLDASCAALSKPRFLFASTLDVYGHTQHLPPPRRIDDPVHATDAYAAHKIACEQRVRDSGLRWSILRFADIPPIAVREPHAMMFRLPLDQRIHCIHPEDAGFALTRAIDDDGDDAWDRVWLIGGADGCRLTYRAYLGAFLEAMGVGALPDDAFSREPYCTDWLDTDDSQARWQYQRKSFDDVVRETAALLGWRAPLARLLRPLVRAQLLRLSPHRKSRS